MIECPYCLDEIKEPDDATACSACGALYHPECWDESEGCCVRECTAARHSIELDVPATETSEVVISRDAAERAIPHSARKVWNPCLRCGRHLPPTELYCQECMPLRDDNQDARNVGPMLVVLLLVILAIGSILVAGKLADKNDGPSPTGIETGLKR